MPDSSTMPNGAGKRSFVRLELQRRYLLETIFVGLPELYMTFDVPAIRYFTSSQFRHVVKRSLRSRVGILGVEVFTPRGRSVGVYIADGDGAAWCLDVLKTYRDKPGLLFSATYSVPDHANTYLVPS